MGNRSKKTKRPVIEYEFKGPVVEGEKITDPHIGGSVSQEVNRQCHQRVLNTTVSVNRPVDILYQRDTSNRGNRAKACCRQTGS